MTTKTTKNRIPIHQNIDVGELQFGGDQHHQHSVPQKLTRNIHNESAVVGLDQNMNAAQQFKKQRIQQQKKLARVARTASLTSDHSNSHWTDRCNDNVKAVIADNTITKKPKSKKDGARKKKKKDGHSGAVMLYQINQILFFYNMCGHYDIGW